MAYSRFLVLLLTALWLDGVFAQEVQDSLSADIIIPDTIILANEMAATELEAPLDTARIDSLLTSGVKSVNTRRMDKSHFKPDPIRAMWLALVFPGGGQIYNRKFWKLPIVYGGFLGCAYALTWNNQMLKDYSQAYLDIMDDNPNTKSYEAMLPMGYDIEGKESKFQTIFKNKKDHYRKYRDMSIFAFAGVYLISVLDAFIDAELSTFDISRNLSLHLEPAVIDMGVPTLRHQHQSAYGLACNFNF